MVFMVKKDIKKCNPRNEGWKKCENLISWFCQI